jgi:CRP/FNR family transcriptional regulator, cyclic AMP receptor protein
MCPQSTSKVEEHVRVLEEDPGLAEGIAPERRERAVADCVAAVLAMPVGRWSGTPDLGAQGGIGLLVLDGLLVRRVGLDGRYGAELLGEGDLLRPWEGEDEPVTLPLRTGWRVLQHARVAVLDPVFMGHLADYPELGGCLVGRAVSRSRSAVVNMAIVHQARVDARLHMLFWHLAARWGRVGSDGVTVPLTLTHAVLAELAAARRPTVTSALTQLAKRGLVLPYDGGWLLTGEPPGELGELAPFAEAAAG